MFKKALLGCCALFLIFFTLLPFTFPPPAVDYAQPIKLTGEKVIYNLPYPGLLPDHPLYFVKIVRDRMQEFITRDNLKKAELYLLLSDKRVAMAQALAKNGKDRNAITTISKAEKYFEKIPRLLVDSKKQGVAASSEFVSRLRLSNAKHKEVIETFLKELPQGNATEVNEILEKNRSIKSRLDRL